MSHPTQIPASVKAFVNLITTIATRQIDPEDPVVRLTSDERHQLLEFDLAGLPRVDGHFVTNHVMNGFRADYEYVARLYAAQAGVPLPSDQKRKSGGYQRQIERSVAKVLGIEGRS